MFHIDDSKKHSDDICSAPAPRLHIDSLEICNQWDKIFKLSKHFYLDVIGLPNDKRG